MKKPQLFELIRLVTNLTGIEQPIIVGSQSLYATTDLVPLNKLIEHLRRNRRPDDLRPLTDLASRLS